MKKLKVASLFSGIGTPEYALKLTSIFYELIFACEKDKFARKTFQSNFNLPEIHFHKDILSFNATVYKKDFIDLLIGGTPCQPFSLSGKLLGLNDTRGTLFYEYARVLSECSPKSFVFENVKALITNDKPKKEILLDGMVYKAGYPSLCNKSYDGHKKGIGKTLYLIEKTFISLGYCIQWDILNSLDYNLPQKRERLYIVGFKEKKHQMKFSFSPLFKLREKTFLYDVLDVNIDSSLIIKDEALIAALYKNKLEPNKEFFIQNNPCAIPFAKRGRYMADKTIKQTLECHLNLYANCLTTVQKDSMVIIYKHQEPFSLQNFVFKKYSISEYLNIQGFNNDFIIPVSLSKAIKQVGNAMSVDILFDLILKIEKVLKK